MIIQTLFITLISIYLLMSEAETLKYREIADFFTLNRFKGSGIDSISTIFPDLKTETDGYKVQNEYLNSVESPLGLAYSSS